MRLDTIRGVLLVIITIDHLGGSLNKCLYEPFGFVSCAAAFVLLSGYMYAYTSGRLGTTAYLLTLEATKRAWKIYKYHAFTLIFFLVFAACSDVHLRYWAKNLFVADGKALSTVIAGLLLVHQPALMDILPMYIIFSLLSPFALICFIKGKHQLVLLTSLALWLCAQYFDPMKALAVQTQFGARASVFNVLAWQSLWVAGLYCGFAHKSQCESSFLKHRSTIWAAGILAVGFLVLKHSGNGSLSGINLLVGKADMQIGRLINIGCQIIIFCHVLRLIESTSHVRWLSYLGRNSLQVFSFHIVVIYVLQPITWRIEPMFGYGGEIAYQLIVAASLTIAPLLYLFYKVHVERVGNVVISYVRQCIGLAKY